MYTWNTLIQQQKSHAKLTFSMTITSNPAQSHWPNEDCINTAILDRYLHSPNDITIILPHTLQSWIDNYNLASMTTICSYTLQMDDIKDAAVSTSGSVGDDRFPTLKTLAYTELTSWYEIYEISFWLLQIERPDRYQYSVPMHSANSR